MIRWRICVLLFIVVLAACREDAIRSTSPEITPATREATRAVAAPQIAPATFSTNEPGIACFGSNDGLSCLTPTGEWERFRRQSSPLGANFIVALDDCTDGAILIAHSNGLSAYDGAVWQEIDFDQFSLSGIACDSPRDFWVTYFRGAAHYVDGRFRRTPSSELGLDEMTTDLVTDVVRGQNSVPWIVTANSIATPNDSEWTVIQENYQLTDRAFFRDIVVDGDDHPWAIHTGGIITSNDGYWQSYETDFFTTATVGAIDVRGRLWVGSWSDGIAMFSDGVWSYDEALNAGLAGRRIQVLDVDARGRLWVGTEDGLFIRDDGEWRVIRAVDGEGGLLSSDVSSIAIIGAGPSFGE